MKNLSTIVLLLAVVLLVSCSNKERRSFSDNFSNKKEGTITYAFKGINYSKSIDFIDNEFIKIETLSRVNGETTVKKHFGTFTKKNKTITLHPEKVEIIRYAANKEEEERNTFAYDAKSGRVNTCYHLVIWETKEYLLSEEFNSMANYDEKNDFQRFSYYFNTGIEPDEGGYYFKRTIAPDSTNVPFDIEQIPEKWRSYFLVKPISANIIHTEKRVKKSKFQEYFCWRIQLDKGANDGIQKGISFSTKFEDFYIEVDSILPDVCYGNFRINGFDDEFIKVGTEMRTQWESSTL